MRQVRFLLWVMVMVINTINGFSQTSLNDLDIVYKNNFENNTLGYYNYSEWYEDFLQPTWANRQNLLEISQVASDEVNPSKTMKISYPAHSTGPEEGGTNWWTLFDGQTELYMSYDIFFMPGFDFAKGGKIFSFQAGEFSATSVTGYDVATMGMMFNDESNVTFYFYYPDSKVEEYGETIGWGYPSYPENYYEPSKIDIKYTSKTYARLTAGTWHNITYRAVLNTVPSEGVGEYNGIMEGYIDGKLVIQVDSILFRLTNNLKIDHIRMSTFFGGNRTTNGDTYWENIIEEWQKVDNMMLYNYKNDTVVPRGNVLSPTYRTVNYWRNFGNSVVEPVIPTDTSTSTNNIKINFVRDETLVATSDWNNLITRTSGTTHHLTNDKGQSTGIDLYVNSGEIYSSVGGSFPGIYCDEVMKTSWRADNYTTKTIQIRNLNTGKKYKFEIFGSNSEENYSNNYTVSNITKSLNIYKNTNKAVSWTIKPSSANIDISWNGGSGFYGFLNSLLITEVGDDAIVDNSPPQIQDQIIHAEETDYESPHIGFISASNPDQTEILKYSIISGNEQNLFYINQSTGELSTTDDGIFSFSKLEYKLIVKVEDNASVKQSGQATITITLVPDPNTVYINPDNLNDVNENGTIEHPYDSWKDITWKNSFKYYQKRGTIAKEDKISISCEGATIGSYGEGEYPVINSNSQDYALQALDKNNLTVTNIHIVADNALSCIYLLGNETSEYIIRNCILENSENGVRIIEGKQITLKYNTFKNCTWGVYSLAGENNIFYNIFKTNEKAIEIASLSSITKVYNNVFYENENGISSSYGDLSLYNNIFYLAKDGDVALNLKLDTFLSDNNIYYPERDGFIAIADKTYNNLKDFSDDFLIDLNSFSKDPLFVDIYNDNFAVSQYSPAINSGKILGLDKDFFGMKVPYAGLPDIGIYEISNGNINTAAGPVNNNDNSIFSIYPNPSKGQVSINLNAKGSDTEQSSLLKVIDQTGKTVYSKVINQSGPDGFETIDLSSMTNGLYYFLLQMVDKTITEKLILIH